MPTLTDRDYVVHCRAEGVGILQGEVHGAATYTAYGLCRKHPPLILFVLGPVSLLFVRSVSHIFHHNAKEPGSPTLSLSLFSSYTKSYVMHTIQYHLDYFERTTVNMMGPIP